MKDRSFKKLYETDDGKMIRRGGFAAVNLTELIDEKLRLECFNHQWECMENGKMPHKGLTEILRPHLPVIEKAMLKSVTDGSVEYDSEQGPPDVVEVDLDYLAYTVEHVLSQIIKRGMKEYKEKFPEEKE